MEIKRYRKFESRVTTVEINPDDYRVDITLGERGKREKLSNIYGEPRINEVPIIRMNLAFFDPSTSYENIGTYVDEGKYIYPVNKDFLDLIFYKNNEMKITKLNNHEEVRKEIKKSNWIVGLSFSLLEDGKISLRNVNPFPHYRYRHPRTAIGQKENKNIVLTVVDGRWYRVSKGVNAMQLASIMRDEGCKLAINCDGGGSSEIIIGDKIYNRPSDLRERKIGSALVVYKEIGIEDIKNLPIIKRFGLYRKGIYIHFLQRLLIHYGFNPGPVDGIVGRKTINAVKQYQRRKGLKVDGIVGPNTWRSLLDGLEG